MSSKPGQVITFYSYKGGTGRSMALANIACYLARSGRVLAIDWDLDAPGLTQYFRSIVDPDELHSKQGVLEFFESWQEAHSDSESSEKEFESKFPFLKEDYVIATNQSNLSFMSSGRADSTYARRLLNFRWDLLYERFPRLFSAFADYLTQSFDYVLIDSRSGFSDVAGICTALLPEKLVAVFTPNRQNLLGLNTVLRRSIEYRKQSDDVRPLAVFPLASRVDVSEPQLFEQWRFSQIDLGGSVFGYQSMFENLFKEMYGLAACDLTGYFDENQIQHVPRYSYGEEIAQLVERSERLSLSRSYAEFGDTLTTLSAPWEAKPSSKRHPLELKSKKEVVDRPWFTAHRKIARRGLKDAGFSGFAEFRASLLQSRPNANQAQLLDATRKSLIRAFGWPIGILLENREEARPRPVRDGIVAEVSLKQSAAGPSYDYWAWRRNGDFYLLQALFEDERTEKATRLLFDTRIIRLTETLLYCSRVYRALAVPGEASVHVTARWGGLRGRKLDSADQLRFLESRNTIEDTIHSSLDVPLARIRSETVDVVKELISPLFIVFDFLQLSDQVYKEIVEDFLKKAGSENLAAVGYRVDIESLRLEVEQLGTQWSARVYDLTIHQTVYETVSQDEQSAKVDAVSFAYMSLGRSGVETTPETVARMPWQLFRPI
jgi:cellulose biosynthesis protein BcsQ